MPSGGRIRAIWACAREHGIDREGVHEAIWAGWKKSSVKDLTDWEADRLLDGMRGKRFERATGAGQPWERRQAMRFQGRKDDSDPTNYLLTEEEKGLLWRVAWNLGMTEEGYAGFVARQLGHTGGARTVREGNKVLWGLKAMQRRDQRKRGGEHVA